MNDADTNTAALDLTIVEALSSSGTMAMAHSTLLQHVRIRATPKPYTSEVAKRIRVLDSKGLLVSIQGDHGYKYKLTDEGKAYWAEHGE